MSDMAASFKTRHLTIGNLAAILIIAMLSVAAYFLIQFTLHEYASDAGVINLAGRQRMLSQKLAKELLLLSQTYDANDRVALSAKLRKTTDTWSRVHGALRYGDKELGLPPIRSGEIDFYFVSMEPHFKRILKDTEEVLAMGEGELSALSPHSPIVREAVHSSQLYLEIMDKAVAQFEKEAGEHVDTLRRYQKVILFLLLLALVMEGLLIFRPMVKKVRETYEEYQRANDRLQDEITERIEAQEELLSHTHEMEKALFRAEEVLNLIAKPPDIVPAFVVSPAYRSVRTIGGGDAIRWLNFRSRYAAIYMHDVSGHDIQEILLNILATAIADDHKTNPGKKAVSSPAVFLTEMNERLMVFCKDTPHYLTALYLLMDYEERLVRFSLAGHPRPWLIGDDGAARQIGSQGFLMGQFPVKPEDKEHYIDTKLRLGEGELLFLYTDGLMEQADSYGNTFEERFRGEILPRLAGLDPMKAYALLKTEFEKYLGGRSPDDDVSFIFVGMRPEKRYEKFSFVPGPRLARQARERWLARHGADGEALLKACEGKATPASGEGHAVIENITDAFSGVMERLRAEGWDAKKVKCVEIALSEMVLNAVTHGNLCSAFSAVEIRSFLGDGVLEVCVSDEGRGFDSTTLSQTIEDEDILRESGRGLHMLNAYADRVFFNESGNRCWALFARNTGRC